MKDIRHQIGIRIAEIREKRGMTQAELAEKTGFEQSNISRIERGKYSVRIDILHKIAEALGVSIELLEK